MLDRAATARGLPSVPRPLIGLGLRERHAWPLVAGYALFNGVWETAPSAVLHHVAS